ncbi:hypothetical protein DWB77_04154 [Streptomyces hundungensis]|uniref:DUF397 domain-containing protein n=1 Tax=Streptomyces hundungensis TaxID=1077946 RepID=A0A387HDQ5_9ACTN|nr:DUF397 domain-containing protein [Streptomyces hundungensis]AYG81986.1 hypothetical protein DWB77_04154 [Streptomyces hundungensis]
MSSTLRWFKSSYSDSGGGQCIEVAVAWRKSSYSSDSGGECIEVALPWRKSTYSSDSGGNCVEVAPCCEAVHVRDSKVADGPSFAVGAQAWDAFLNWGGAAAR